MRDTCLCDLSCKSKVSKYYLFSKCIIQCVNLAFQVSYFSKMSLVDHYLVPLSSAYPCISTLNARLLCVNK